jgi:hypothetical protein
MPAIRKFRVPQPMKRRLKYLGTENPPQSPTLADVMKALSQVQQNQTDIMNTLNAIIFNQMTTLVYESSMGVNLAPNQAVADQIENDFQTAWSQAAS